ncbi:MAG TPA: hypothetical protein VIK99_03930 [Thermaerobacter sp.]
MSEERSTPPSPPSRTAVRRSDIEDLLSRLPGVLAVRLSVNDWGAIEAVHVLATIERGAKQIVRDIESALQARFGLRLDHKKVSVAQVSGLGPLRDPVRPELTGYVVQTEATTGETRVEVTFGDPRDESARWTGAASGGTHRRQQARTALVAVLEALRPLLVQERELELVDCDLILLGEQEILVALFALPSGRGAEPQLFTGAAPVGSAVVEAAVRAFLQVYYELLELRWQRARRSPAYRLLELGRRLQRGPGGEAGGATGQDPAASEASGGPAGPEASAGEAEREAAAAADVEGSGEQPGR